MSALSHEAQAGLLDHALLAPILTGPECRTGRRELRPYPIATARIMPHAGKVAIEGLAGTDFAMRTVIGFPQGIDQFLTDIP